MRLQLGLPREFRSHAQLFHLKDKWSYRRCLQYIKKVDSWALGEGLETISDEDEEAASLLTTSWSREAWRNYYPRGIPVWQDILFDVAELHDGYLEIGYGTEEPGMFERFRAQAKSLNFGTGEHTQTALERLIRDAAAQTLS